MSTKPEILPALSSPELRQKSVDMFLASTPPFGAAIEQYRLQFDRMLSEFALDPAARFSRYQAGTVPGIRIDMPESRPDRVVIHFHSGGYVMGSAQAYREFGSRLAQAAGAVVILPEYRLAPENPFPAPVEDALATYRWALETWTPETIVVSGDSAGGGLMMALLLALRDAGDPLPRRAVGISPLFDLAGEGESMVSNAESDPLIDRTLLVEMGKVYIGDRDPHQHPLASPLWGKHHGLPPLFLTASNSEVMRDDAVRLADSVSAAGGAVSLSLSDGMIHIWTIFPFLAEAKRSLAAIGAFIQSGWPP